MVTKGSVAEIDSSFLLRTAGRGASWQIFGGIWQIVIRLGASTILARLLTPEDFGIVALSVMLYGLFSQVSVLSSITGILAKPNVTSEDINTSFWMGACVQLFLFLLINLSAPLLGKFLSDERLIKVLHIYSFVFLFSLMGNLPMAIMMKRLLFKYIVWVNAVAVLFEMGFALFLVEFANMGYWSLVWAMVLSNLGMNLAYLFMGGWLPELRFSKPSFFYLIRYGISGLGVNVCIYIRQNIDYLIIGKTLGSLSLGLYSFAYKIPDIILKRLAMPAGGVVLPAASHLRGENKLIISAYTKASQYLTFMTFPLLAGLGFLAKPLVQLLWGDQWLLCVVPLRILCIATAISCISITIGTVFLCKDKPGLLVKLEVFSMIYTIIWVVPLTISHGLIGAATGMLLSKTSFIVAAHVAFKLTQSSPLLLVRRIFPVILASALCGIFSFICWHLLAKIELHLLLNISLSIFGGGIIYLFIFRSCFNDLWKEFFTFFTALITGDKETA